MDPGVCERNSEVIFQGDLTEANESEAILKSGEKN